MGQNEYGVASESDDIFVFELKAKENRVISFTLSIPMGKIKMLILSSWVP